MASSGNGASSGFQVAGMILADGGLFGLAIRWARSSAGDPEGKEHPWTSCLIVLAAASKTAVPMGKRSQMFLSPEDAPKFGVVGQPSQAMVKDLEISGPGLDGDSIRIPATVRGIYKEPGSMTTLAIDSTIGVFTVDAQASTWSWTIPRPT